VNDAISEMRAPILALAVNQDRALLAGVEAFAASVRAAGAEAEVHVVPDGACRSVDHPSAEYLDEHSDAWRHILDFIDSRRR